MSDTITIGGREFRVGAWYHPRRRQGMGPARKLLAYRAEFEWPYVEYEARNGRVYRNLGPKGWTDWAGDEVAP